MSLVEICSRQWAECVRASLKSLASIPTERQITIRYEELVTDPRCVDTLCDFLAVPDRDIVASFYRDSLRKIDRGKWRSQFSSDERAKMMSILNPVLVELGYIS